MKSIIVNFKNAVSAELVDYDTGDVEEYAEKLSEILKNNNVTVLHTTSGSLIVRPNDVSSIAVCDVDEEYLFEDIDTTSEAVISELKTEETPPTKQVHEDIITD